MNIDEIFSFLRRFGLGGVFIILLVGVVLVSLTVETTLTIDASTEFVELEAASGRLSWFFPPLAQSKGQCRPVDPAVAMTTLSSQGVLIDPAFIGSLELSSGTHVELEREGQGSLTIRIRGAREGESVGEAQRFGVSQVVLPGRGQVLSWGAQGNPERLGALAELEVVGLSKHLEAGCTWLLPLQGRIRVGQQVIQTEEASSPMLLSGKVSMLARTLGGEGFFETGSAMLGLGDQAAMEVSVSKLDPLHGLGLLRLDDRPAMSVTYRAVGQRVRIWRFGNSSGVPVATSLLRRLGQDPQLQRFWGAFLALVLILLAWRGTDGRRR